MESPRHIYSVSEIAHYLNDVITSDDVLSRVSVQGELSDLRRSTPGHLYFSLKDPDACIRCVMWRRDVEKMSKQKRVPLAGEAVRAEGSFSVYAVRGDVQLQVSRIELIGAGQLYEQFLALKRRLEEEGLFAKSRKRSLPLYPRRIGIATSRDGAALQDILRVIRGRYPLPELVLAHCGVQGDMAPDQIVAALNELQNERDLDVIILARGGGSFEDLFCFNDERVARAIVASRVPVVTGVGHETDSTIADFCADLRAPTPTAAAHSCTPDGNEIRVNLIADQGRLARSVRTALEQARRRLATDVNALQRASPAGQVALRRQQIDDLTRVAAAQLQRKLALDRARLNGVERQLRALDPRATLERGYAIVRRDPKGEIVNRESQVHTNDRIRVRVRDGEFQARVE